MTVFQTPFGDDSRLRIGVSMVWPVVLEAMRALAEARSTAAALEGGGLLKARAHKPRRIFAIKTKTTPRWSWNQNRSERDARQRIAFFHSTRRKAGRLQRDNPLSQGLGSMLAGIA